MHINSINAYHEELPKLSKRASVIYNFFANTHSRLERFYTDRQVKTILGFNDMNQVRPRITELIKLGLLEEVGKTKCPITCKMVRVVNLGGCR
jgi:chromosome condensin MukBEF MukE localization factor